MSGVPLPESYKEVHVLFRVGGDVLRGIYDHSSAMATVQELQVGCAVP